MTGQGRPSEAKVGRNRRARHKGDRRP